MISSLGMTLLSTQLVKVDHLTGVLIGIIDSILLIDLTHMDLTIPIGIEIECGMTGFGIIRLLMV